MLSCDVRERRDATIYDVARAVGVSAATVSRILSGTGQFAPATRRAVEEAVRELGYRPNPSARALAIRSTRTIGVRLPPLDNPFCAEVIRGVQAVAASEQFAIVLYTSQLRPDG